MIQCKICGGSLQMNLDAGGATCPRCGVIYPLALLQRMAAEGPGTAQTTQTSAQTQSVRPAPVKPRPVQHEPVRPAPVKPRPAAPAHHIDNERFGLLPSEYRSFKLIPCVPQPVRPGLFAPQSVKADYEQKLRAWQAYQRQQRAGKAERDAYFDKFYERTVPQYTVKEWQPYFEGILAEAFPQYELRRDVAASDLFPTHSNAWTRAAFVLMQGGRPALAIYLASNRKLLRPGACKACISHGIPALTFHSQLSNRREYVIDRVRRALNP